MRTRERQGGGWWRPPVRGQDHMSPGELEEDPQSHGAWSRGVGGSRPWGASRAQAVMKAVGPMSFDFEKSNK